MENTQVLATAIETFGIENQINKAIEECAELIVALSKYQAGQGMMLNLIDEIADVLIMTNQLKIFFDQDLVDSKIRYKLHRLESMIIERQVKHPTKLTETSQG